MFLIIFLPLVHLVDHVLEQVDVDTVSSEAALGVVALVFAMVIAPVLAAWTAAWALRRRTERTRLIIAISALAVWLVLYPAVRKLTGLGENLTASIGSAVISTALVLLFVLVGAGSIIGWALRVAIRHVGRIGSLTSRALPLLLLFLLFGFISTETWQIAEKLEANGHRTSLWLVIGLFALMGSLFLIAILRDEGRDMMAKHRAAGAMDYEVVLRTTPLRGLTQEVRNFPLTLREKANLAVVVYLAQALQAVVFSFVVFCFLVIFGLIAIDDSVIAGWLGHPPSAGGKLFTIPLPGVSDELIRVSMFFAGFSGVYFAASIATDATYRKSFFEPLMADVAVSLAARDAYLTLWEGDETASGYPEEGPLTAEGDLEWHKTQ
ncbi:hypothetical protein LWC34_41705 [Kibdelosporangium philippinense]|uniref:Integral membrane protein n=1 Tax=Kibdelosporangium philippinense TaxID=211113 RepID=A0ABS8ZNF1_9PSEU|nr:hypothetical protein [Kibdelosporangium philippinense]MCE7009286.1 hypothetical protein [Kibdelosporangium philippinense]